MHQLLEVSISNGLDCFSPAADPAAMEADATPIRQVIHRLVINACCKEWDSNCGLPRTASLFQQHTSRIVLVVLYVTIPGLSGEETFRELSKLQPDLPVILTSGYDEQEATAHFAGVVRQASCKSPSLTSSCATGSAESSLIQVIHRRAGRLAPRVGSPCRPAPARLFLPDCRSDLRMWYLTHGAGGMIDCAQLGTSHTGSWPSLAGDISRRQRYRLRWQNVSLQIRCRACPRANRDTDIHSRGWPCILPTFPDFLGGPR
jgi:CheY-like chemotaxis protein